MKNIIYSLLLGVGLCWAFPALAAVQVKVGDDKEIISLGLPKAEPRKVFLLQNPDRLVVDVPSVAGKLDAGLPKNYEGSLLKNLRVGQYTPEVTRFVFELEQPVKIAKVRALLDKARSLEITIAASGEAPAPVTEEEEKPKKVKAVEKPKKETIKKDSAKKEKTTGEKPMIVIDPGHGGIDPGAIGPDGTQEKQAVLEIAKAVKAALLKSGRYRVRLTREDDRFIILRQRVQIARKNDADIFISIHADSALDDEARGLSVYTLSEKASDVEAAALAAKENKADVLAGINLSDESKDVADILISLAQRETNNRSATLADYLVRSLDDRVTLLSNSHRFAGFAVLKAPDVPSVLIESGFISHPKEEQLLKTRKYREKVAEGIVAGLDGYFRQHKARE